MEHKLKEFYSICDKDGNRTPLSKEVLNKYLGKVPAEILELWEVGGLGSYMNGFFWVVNPEEYQDVLLEVYEPLQSTSIVFARDAFGDLFTWEEDRIKFVNVRHGYSQVIGTNPAIFFNKKATDWNFFSKKVNEKNFQEAKEKLGSLEPNECYGYVPILAAGGSEKVEKLKKVKVKEHLSLIAQLAGTI